MYPSIFNDGGVTRAGLETSSVEQLSFFVGLGGDLEITIDRIGMIKLSGSTVASSS